MFGFFAHCCVHIVPNKLGSPTLRTRKIPEPVWECCAGGNKAVNEETDHSPRLPKWITQIVLGVALGLALGFAIGWWFWPVEYTNTAPDVLRRDYRADYILMTATAYEVDGGDVEQAQRRLELLDPQDPAAPVIELAERLVAANGSAEDITLLARLAQAFDSLPPALTPYLEGQP